ncbi:Superfamily II DNA or RNA helicase, SNF2 family [Raineyella antarctica]|uniref:Superfamily II DNA or RNA helicase, SNF2 family n=1 Tax=Raineyella antarctica TaxID=1577474 RepID=A0A1G6GIG8_9ACTN|nr:DEAD/DEAH box helicase [Raineyella antarctica]SDB81709.1 Superfamily II DNA or RNA helicase, SNF2 family [Raineyella antarctica]
MVRRLYPAWVAELGDATLVKRFGAATVDRARGYARQDRIEEWQLDPQGIDIAATVLGSGGRYYRCWVGVVDPDRPDVIVAQCSCPVGIDCKHAVATLLHVRDQLALQSRPAWQQVFDAVVEQGRQRADGPRTPLALEVIWKAPTLAVRPLKRGASGRWVKTGAAWADLRNSFSRTFDEDQRRALLTLEDVATGGWNSYVHAQQRLIMNELPPDAWRHLRYAREAGVAFVSGDGGPVRLLDRPAVLSLDVHAAKGGGVVAEAVVRAGESVLPSPVPVGVPAHGVVAETPEGLLIGPFEAPLTEAQRRLLVQHRQLKVPARDMAGFTATTYVALQSVMTVRPDEDLDLPTLSGPTLLLTVRPEEATRLVLTWGWRYSHGSRTVEAGLAPSPDDPPRDRTAEADLVATLPRGPWSPPVHPADPSTGDEGTIVLTGRDAIGFASEVLPLLQARDDVEVVVEGTLLDYRQADDEPDIRMRVTDPEGPTDWFDLAVEVRVDGQQVPFHDLFRALNLGEDHLVLADGVWFRLDRPEFDRLRALIDEARMLQEPGRRREGLALRPEHAGLWEDLVALGVVQEQSAAWAEATRALLDMTSLPAAPVPDGLDATLRSYQETGFRWLAFLWRARLGGILADDMGLGKTVQALAAIQSIREAGDLDAPALVVAPTSVLGTWAAEAARFAPGLRVRVLGETIKRRCTTVAAEAADADLVITSYAVVRLDRDSFTEVGWSAVLLDEAHTVKNPRSHTYAAIRALRARAKFALTGTPLENNLMDLWALLSIVAPGLFADPKVFTELYRRPIEAGDGETLARLQRRIRPVMLRRTKEKVAAELPAKQEQVIHVDLTPAHRRIYDRQLARERQKVLQLVEDVDKNRFMILRSLTILRQLALAPALVDPDHKDTASSKIDVLVEMLTELASEGHRALVFSQFTTFLGMVRDRLAAEQIGTSYLDGSTRDRAGVIDSFRTGDDPVFLISLKAGGFGLTLTEADYVFILDPWWNPAAEIQAVDRTHRIGQDKPVNVYRLVADNTIEDKVVALQDGKRDLFDRVVDGQGDFAAPLTGEDIRGLLDLA